MFDDVLVRHLSQDMSLFFTLKLNSIKRAKMTYRIETGKFRDIKKLN